MNTNEATYKSILCNFRTVDLQTLLGTFGQSRNGRKNELRDHAIELLRSRQQPGFNPQAYRLKITELYQAQSQVVNTNGVHNLMQNQQRQLISMQPQHQRMYLAPQFVHQQQMQQMHLAQPVPQVMVQRSRGMYRSGLVANHSHLQHQYSYQLTVSRNMAQAPTHQLNNIMINPMNVSGGNNVYHQQPIYPPPPSITNIKFRNLPFNDVVEGLIEPMILNPQDRYSPPAPSVLKETTFKFMLTNNQTNLITLNRDISGGQHQYPFDVQIRFCLLDSGPEIVDCLPVGLAVRVNARIIQLPPANQKPGNKPGVEPRRLPRPLNISHYLKLRPKTDNLITVFWNPDGKLYVVSLNLVKKLTSGQLIDKLLKKRVRSSEETKAYIVRKLTNDDPDLATTSYRVSLICPLGKMRMTMPAKSVKCDHELQCFDANIYILMNEKKPTWTCPTCSKDCLYDDIVIQSYFIDIISSPLLTDSCKEIEVLADGSWRMYEENTNPRNRGTNNTGNPIDSVTLDDSDDEMPLNPQPGTSNETKRVAIRPSLVDLTLSDDDEKPQNPKQENEAQAADAAPTAVDRKPQVQPQQAVTSSEQGDVIEIGSPTPPSSPPSSPPLPWGVL